MRYLDPDMADIKLVMDCQLDPCPFCGDGLMAVINKVNDATGVYRSIISCSKCDAQTSYNARSRDEARVSAVQRWNTRQPAAPK